VADLEPGTWSEPIRSPYGLHLVWVSERDVANVPALDAVRSRVLSAYRAERRAEYLTRMVDELRAAYEVRIEHDAPTS
jgi:parvulin-like peptidyl-prolyl isomerase